MRFFFSRICALSDSLRYLPSSYMLSVYEIFIDIENFENLWIEPGTYFFCVELSYVWLFELWILLLWIILLQYQPTHPKLGKLWFCKWKLHGKVMKQFRNFICELICQNLLSWVILFDIVSLQNLRWMLCIWGKLCWNFCYEFYRKIHWDMSKSSLTPA